MSEQRHADAVEAAADVLAELRAWRKAFLMAIEDLNDGANDLMQLSASAARRTRLAKARTGM